MFKRFSIILIMTLALSVFAVGASASTVYVKEGANGNGASSASPMGSITDAFASLTDGGEIIVIDNVTLPQTNFPLANGDVKISGGSLTLLSDIAFAKNTNGATITLDLPVTSNGAAIFGGFNSIVFGENFAVDGTVDFYGGVQAAPGTQGEHDANYALNATMVTELP